MLPSCVPATGFDESGAVLRSDDLEPFYEHPRVLGLAEMMNYPCVLADDSEVLAKIAAAKKRRLKVNGHAPLLSGKNLDKYIAAGISDDHECSSFDEARERIRKGQWVMIREGTSARNLDGLINLFDEPYAHRCILVTDDKHPADLLQNGHIDSIIRKAVQQGKSALLRRAVYDMGADNAIEPFMSMAFMSQPVIPNLKMTTKGLINVNKQELVSLFTEDK